MKAALIGKGIGGSRTPEMHIAEGAAQGLPYQFDRIDVATDRFSGVSLKALLDMAEQEGLAGVNVTYPFKISAVELMDELSPVAACLGAVNAVVFQNGKRVGHNTDYTGFTAAFAREIGGKPTDHVLQIGAGGAGAAVALSLIDAGVGQLSVSDRNPEMARALCDRLNALRPKARIRVADEADMACDGLVNCTPMGMAAYPGMAVDPGLIPTLWWVCDIVYFPIETALIKAARSRGCKLMRGDGMAVGQAAESFALFTGHKADATRMAAHFETIDNEART